MDKAIFLDRDGVLIKNDQHYYIWKPDQVEFVEGVFENLRLLQQKGFKLFIVSNQGGISKGCFTKNDMLELHEKLISTFSENQISISDILFCPHHPSKEKCLCRKPGSLMIEKLIAKHTICPTESMMIGDSKSDMEAAELAGIRGLRISANKNMLPFISNILV